ncbi:hypothetical protein CAL14_19705 [Bordetella genomosp. 9]|uniref:IS66 family transposase n=1 Tax=Bordetella genomosp. 9 TaxID=1416803 RepID=UPI000A29083F|nr:hypothetical protein CAL14_19705 [Bordetella genomosp. 9]
MPRGIAEMGCMAGCMARAGRKSHDVHASTPSQTTSQTLALFGFLYGVERAVADLPADGRQRMRQGRAADRRDAAPMANGAIAYSLIRWEALTRCLDDRHASIEHNWVETRFGSGRAWELVVCGSMRAASVRPPSSLGQGDRVRC